MNEGPYIKHVFGKELSKLYSSHIGWLTCAVHHSIAWPEKDVLIHYNGEDFFLRGLEKREGNLTSACLNLRLPDQDKLHKQLKSVYEFTSILGWFKGGYVDVVGHISGSHPILYDSGRQPSMPVMCSGPYGFNCNFMPILSDDNQRKALAFWREGLRLKHIHEGYSFLSFYKVIESQFKPGKEKGHWINNAISDLDGKAGDRVTILKDDGIDAGLHVFKSCRCAVAHASLNGEMINPDIPKDRIRIHQDLVIIQALAEKFIREELEIPDKMDVFKNRDALKPLYNYIDPAHLEILKNEGTVPRKQLGLNGLEVSINHWPYPALPSLEKLHLRVKLAHSGVVDLLLENSDRSLSLAFILSFIEQKAGPDIENSKCSQVEKGGNPDDEIAFYLYQKSVLGNGIIEIKLPNDEIIVCEVIIPVNIDLTRTFEHFDKRIEKIEIIAQQ